MQSHLNYIRNSLSDTCEPAPCALIVGSPTAQFMTAALREFPQLVFSAHEVHETALQELKSFTSHPNFILNENLVSVQGGLVEYHQYNQRRFNGLSPVKANQSILPNIRSLGFKSFVSECFDVACKAAGVHERGNHILIFGLQATASALCCAPLFSSFRKFRFVLLQATSTALYDAEHSKQNVVELLKLAGFAPVAQTAAALYPFEDILFERDDEFLFKAETLEALSAAKLRISELEGFLSIADEEKGLLAKQLNAKVHEHAEAVKQASTEIKAVQDTLTAKTDTCSKAEAKAKAFEAELLSTKAAHAESQKQLDAERKAKSELEKQLNAKVHEHAEAVKQASNEIKTVQDTLTAKTDACSKAEVTAKAFEAELLSTKASHAESQKQLDAERKAKSELEKQLSARVHEHAEAVKQASTELKAVQDTLTAKTDACSKAEVKAKAFEAELLSTKAAHAESQKQLDAERKAKSELEKQLSAKVHEHAEAVKQASTEIKAVQDSLTAKTDACSKAEAKAKAFESELLSTKAAHAESQKQLDAERKAKSEFEKQLNAKVHEHAEAVKQASNEIKTVQEALIAKTDTCSKAEAKAKAFEAELLSTKAAHAESQSKLNLAQEASLAKAAEVKAVTDELAAERKARADSDTKLKAELKTVQEEFSLHQTQRQVKQAAYEQILQSKQVQVEKLQTEVQQLKQSNSQELQLIKKQLQISEDKFAALNYENESLKNLTYELNRKVLKTEGQLSMIQEIYIAERSAQQLPG